MSYLEQKRNALLNSVGELPPLPSEYQQVEYIGNTSQDYIDTNFYPSETTEIDIDFACMYSGDDESVLFGIRSGSSNNGFVLYVKPASGFAQHYILIRATPTSNDTRWVVQKSLTVGEFYNYKFFGYQKMILTESGGTEYSNPKYSKNKPMTLFCLNRESYQEKYGKFRIARCKIYDEHELERDFIPCYRKSDNEIGMYDLVYREFYTNQGSGTFEKGADVN